ncbi:FtsW/RodA/SpoVE family cell cycle protein [Amycolatopsis sp. CA-230715]|uniref:FtsW/RodA/SpoVE family cell cycle protein n=1 Tax=Amycolatopsis sp. CA-230715 TaxID=2745196 RepID=UPI001C0394C3|nr:FtsW/RodA/SpoVE family cell cycle protein [Amycolatopsis sp. CA-230715]QWF84140.1 putative FtsW-like protein [Amycolatopsis sp. CA-230715]
MTRRAEPEWSRAAAPRRSRELALLGLASAVTTVALVLVRSAVEQPVGLGTLLAGAAHWGLFACAHLALRRWAPGADQVLLPCVAMLNGLGLVLIHRLDLATGSADVVKQLAWTVSGVGLFVTILAVVRDHRRLTRLLYVCGLAGFALLLLPGVLPSALSEANGAKRWIRLGGLGFQPGELGKPLFVVFVAGLLMAKRDLLMTMGRRVAGLPLPRARDLGPLLAVWAMAICVVAAEKDLGTALLLFTTVLVMIYVVTSRLSWLAIGFVLLAAGSVLAYHLFGHVRVRVASWLDPFADYTGGGYQLAQGLFGFGTGGMLGTGLGRGRPETVPFANSDFMTATIGEELGMTGLTAVLLVYLVLGLRGLRAGLKTRDGFGKLLASGLAFALVAQVFLVVAGVLKLLPLKGITLPFVAYGGSSLLGSYFQLALLTLVSQAAATPPPVEHPVSPPIADARTVMVGLDTSR